MRRTQYLCVLASAAALLLPVHLLAQFSPSGSTSISVTVGPEAAIRIDSATSTLTTSGVVFGSDFTGSTAFTYKIRTRQGDGSGNVQLQVMSDFSPAGGPSVATPPDPEDTLGYTCNVSEPASGCSGRQTASTTVATPVATFGANARSTRTGNSGSVNWTLANDPQYATGTFTALVTLTISTT
ncbi:MAG TPA: hypothetical protein VHA11_04325 [Bryobacteraceae bacterium]|nr:hypothetical protein [Bryobacteraceae bacterium]